MSKSPILVQATLETGRIQFTFCDQEWILHRPADLEALWNALGDKDFTEDERLPYWVELWPASLALAALLKEKQNHIKGRLCLDLGCGLGFTALTASALGARVLAIDYETEALRYAQKNAFANTLPSPVWAAMDWRAPALAQQSCAYIWGGDILYEKRFAEPVAALLEHALAPGGRVWMAEPGRNTFAHFLHRLLPQGWQASCIAEERVEALHTQTTPVSVKLWELRR